jgi:hypothetical protein
MDLCMEYRSFSLKDPIAKLTLVLNSDKAKESEPITILAILNFIRAVSSLTMSMLR